MARKEAVGSTFFRNGTQSLCDEKEREEEEEED
jgi:hypothetical protein